MPALPELVLGLVPELDLALARAPVPELDLGAVLESVPAEDPATMAAAHPFLRQARTRSHSSRRCSTINANGRLVSCPRSNAQKTNPVRTTPLAWSGTGLSSLFERLRR